MLVDREKKKSFVWKHEGLCVWGGWYIYSSSSLGKMMLKNTKNINILKDQTKITLNENNIKVKGENLKETKLFKKESLYLGSYQQWWINTFTVLEENVVKLRFHSYSYCQLRREGGVVKTNFLSCPRNKRFFSQCTCSKILPQDSL